MPSGPLPKVVARAGVRVHARPMKYTGLVVWLALVASYGCKKEAAKQAPVEPAKPVVTAAKSVEAPKPKPPELTPFQKAAGAVMRATSLREATQAAKPFMRDTVGEDSEGGALVALWLSSHAYLPALKGQLQGTEVKLVFKDSEEHRGKVLCVVGKVIEIAASKELYGKTYRGLLLEEQSDIVRFHALGSTGKIIDGSKVEFCGVATGKFGYKSTDGSERRAVSIVGIFTSDATANEELNRQGPTADSGADVGAH